MESKITTKHKKDCIAIRAVKDGYWDTPWSGIVKESFFGSKIGTRNSGSIIWHVISCNDSNCKAKKIVNASVLNKA